MYWFCYRLYGNQNIGSQLYWFCYWLYGNQNIDSQYAVHVYIVSDRMNSLTVYQSRALYSLLMVECSLTYTHTIILLVLEGWGTHLYCIRIIHRANFERDVLIGWKTVTWKLKFTFQDDWMMICHLESRSRSLNNKAIQDIIEMYKLVNFEKVYLDWLKVGQGH